jgi:alcohol dehydrogenase (cytochrome c)
MISGQRELHRDGKQYMAHPNKSGFIFVYDRADAKVENVWPIVQNHDFVPKTGELIRRRAFTAGTVEGVLCPHISGGVSWNSGSYNPNTGLGGATALRAVLASCAPGISVLNIDSG